MRFPLSRVSCILLSAAVLFSLAGCGPQSTVNLRYTPLESNVLPAPNAPRLTVVLFEDARGKSDLGSKNDGTAFVASSPVNEWISRSLADEISRMGPQVSYATSLQEAQAAQPDFIVTGTVHEVWIKEENPTTYSTAVRFTFSLSNKSGRIYGENLSSRQERSGLPTASFVDDAMGATLREVLGVAASKINEAVKKR